jgi:hypothetical protein
VDIFVWFVVVVCGTRWWDPWVGIAYGFAEEKYGFFGARDSWV